ncbi:hypothetical protein [Clostridium oryzae]|uniref:Uncharacterized protein n=1 Tax=Clostridium oryzae TaxID=1450648 RepID=A0A1V4IUV6_9CLOT|nr:hypothetical protein [Clostridium oryzae]OPJ63564.1 hypothetical protein CLORY_10720 [Clostridium oryzae]
MKRADEKAYLPDERDYLEQDPEELRSFYKKHRAYSNLPDPVEDSIVVNNIACSEFDYTEGSQLKK